MKDRCFKPIFSFASLVRLYAIHTLRICGDIVYLLFVALSACLAHLLSEGLTRIANLVSQRVAELRRFMRFQSGGRRHFEFTSGVDFGDMAVMDSGCLICSCEIYLILN